MVSARKSGFRSQRRVGEAAADAAIKYSLGA